MELDEEKPHLHDEETLEQIGEEIEHQKTTTVLEFLKTRVTTIESPLLFVPGLLSQDSSDMSNLYTFSLGAVPCPILPASHFFSL